MAILYVFVSSQTNIVRGALQEYYNIYTFQRNEMTASIAPHLFGSTVYLFIRQELALKLVRIGCLR
jgi:hypothetical protein